MTTKHTPQQTLAGHTPGPWKLRPDSTLGGLYSEIIGKDTIYKVWGVVVSKIPTKNAEQRANAQLIESAPEMLEALEDILQRLEDDLFLAGVPREQHKDQRHLKRLYKAIAKAKGQTSLSPHDKQGEV